MKVYVFNINYDADRWITETYLPKCNVLKYYEFDVPTEIEFHTIRLTVFRYNFENIISNYSNPDEIKLLTNINQALTNSSPDVVL